MKKYIFLAVISVMTLAVSAQSTTPRFGTAPNQDNTGRTLTYGYVAKTDAAGADSLALNTNAFETIVRITLVDSFTLKQPVVTRAYQGDKLVIVCSAASGTPKLKFTGSNWINAGTATLSTGLRAIITLYFDGAKWVEASRVVQ